jgi:hypothetical protein
VQRASTMRARQPSTVVIDPDMAVSRYLGRKVRQLIASRAVQPWSIDGQDLRERRDLLAAGRRFPTPRLVRGTVRRHRVELSLDTFGATVGRCDCEASRWGRLCSHLLAFAVIAVAELRWGQV